MEILHLEKTYFLVINAKTKSQMRGNCAADQRMCLRFRDNTNVSDPEDSFSLDAAHIQVQS